MDPVISLTAVVARSEMHLIFSRNPSDMPFMKVLTRAVDLNGMGRSISTTFRGSAEKESFIGF